MPTVVAKVNVAVRDDTVSFSAAVTDSVLSPEPEGVATLTQDWSEVTVQDVFDDTATDVTAADDETDHDVLSTSSRVSTPG